VKFYTQSYSYDYPFSTVTLAYFLRYPNPYSRHVLSTDVIDRHFDPETQQLHTTRLHLKRSRLPAAVLKLLPKSILGAGSNGDSQTYILETSTVDVREGWMKTESRNLEFTHILDAVERQIYRRPNANLPDEFHPRPSSPLSYLKQASSRDALADLDNATEVTTSVTLHSRLGQRFRRAKAADGAEVVRPEKLGFFRSWSQASLQRSIEAIGLNRTSKSQPNAKEGMKVVLERLRQGGLVAVLDGMRRDREAGMNGGLKILPGSGGDAGKRG